MNTNPLSSSQPPTTQNATDASDDSSISKKNFDPREYRPLDVIVSITMHDIQAHLMKVKSMSIILIVFPLILIKFLMTKRIFQLLSMRNPSFKKINSSYVPSF